MDAIANPYYESKVQYIYIKFTYLKMLLIYGSSIILKIKLVIAFKIWIGNNIQSLNFGSLIQSCQIGVLVQSIHSCGTLMLANLFLNLLCNGI